MTEVYAEKLLTRAFKWAKSFRSALRSSRWCDTLIRRRHITRQQSLYLSNFGALIKTHWRYVDLAISAILWYQNDRRTPLPLRRKLPRSFHILFWSTSIQISEIFHCFCRSCHRCAILNIFVDVIRFCDALDKRYQSYTNAFSIWTDVRKWFLNESAHEIIQKPTRDKSIYGLNCSWAVCRGHP